MQKNLSGNGEAGQSADIEALTAAATKGRAVCALRISAAVRARFSIRQK
jgi:hypothetical protein